MLSPEPFIPPEEEDHDEDLEEQRQRPQPLEVDCLI